MKPYVYMLTHKETQQFYIGYREMNKHPAEQDIVTYRSSSSLVKRMEFKNFEHVILKEFDDGKDAYAYENSLIEENIKNPLCLNGHYTKAGKLQFRRVGPHTEETRNKISISSLGKSKSDTHRKNIALSQIGREATFEAKLNMSKAQIGKIKSDTHRKNIGKANLGKKHTEETKINLRNLSPEINAKKGPEKGCIFSKEHREKLCLAKKGKKRGPRSAETKAKNSAGNKNYFEKARRNIECVDIKNLELLPTA